MDDKTLVERLMEFEKFIRGQGALDGAWFGDTRSDFKGAFWWRRFSPIKEAADTIEAQAEEKKALQSRIEALEAEKLKSLALQDLAYQNGAQQYAAMAAQSPEAAAKWLQNLSRRSDGLRVLNDAKQALESQP